ncbi:S1C family serine protease [Saliphagus infecundisoli]|uniref:S1C family serine protease n=1 Tax=Saliphagus infecundisoli TaxID=1849069 RepID=A0ABD5QGY9_9EURY|nr:trypsin-like peptidase domain-containing protein [Saliphagus infecundisoli]
MTPNQPSRRAVLSAAGVTLASALAGCSAENIGSVTANGTDGDSENETDESGNDSAPSAAGSTGGYAAVYDDVIGSVVLVRVGGGSAGSQGSGGGQGSGWVYRDGYVVTNAHVVTDATDVQVRFAEGEWRDGSVVGTDASSDLAVIEVDEKPDYAEALSLVESQPAVGTEVLAIGNPYGLEGSVTSGLVSGVNRSIPAPNGYTIPDGIQTGAPVNPGNSGGPLVTTDGEVVGVINSGGGENLAFAISAALVDRVVPALVEDGSYDHPYLGIGFRTVTPEIASQAGLDGPRGVAVARVEPDGPSADALRQGDVVVGVAGRTIDDGQELSSYLALEASPEETVELAVRRDGERRTVSVTLGVRPERPATASR